MKLKSIINELIDKLHEEGKVKTINIEFSDEFYENMKKVNEDSRRKQAQSWMDCKNIILD